MNKVLFVISLGLASAGFMGMLWGIVGLFFTLFGEFGFPAAMIAITFFIGLIVGTALVLGDMD